MANEEFLYLHHAHMKDRRVGVGDKILRGTPIGSVGDTGNADGAHDHFEVRPNMNEGPNFYPKGWLYTKNRVAGLYINPYEYLAANGVLKPFNFTTIGFGYLQWTGDVYHPGIDLNLPGNADYGLTIYASQDATVVYSALASGWGNHIWLKVRNPFITPAVPLLLRVNEAIRKATGQNEVKEVVSRFFQEWVLAGKPGNYKELVDDVTGFFKRNEYPFSPRLLDRVNEAIREAVGQHYVTQKVSNFFQDWVKDGKPGSYKELVDDIKGFKSRHEYPFDE